MSSNARLNAGIQHHRAGRLAEAEAVYREVLRQQPDNADALHVSGVLAGQRGEIDRGIELLRRAVKVNPQFAEAWRNLGALLSEKGRFREAGLAFQQVLQNWESDWSEHGQLGAKFATNEYLQEATAAFAEATRIKPGYAEALNDLGNLLAVQNRVDEAIAAHSKAIALSPGFAEAHYGLGNLLSRKGRTEEALAALRRAAELKPGFADAHLNYGNMLRRLGRMDEAVAAYRRAVQVRPNFAVAFFNMGQAYNSVSRLEEALGAFASALRVKPDYVRAHVRMAAILSRLDRFEEANAAQARAAALAPQSAEVAETLGEILVRQQRAADAEPHFRRAIELDPKLSSAWNGLGNALQSVGKFEEASACYRRVLELSPDYAIGFGYRNLAGSGRITPEQKELDRLWASVNNPESPADNRVAAGFALGKMLDDAGRFDEAFSAYEKANGLYKQIRAGAGDTYQPELVRRNVDRTIAAMDRAYFEQRQDWGERSELPVFVVGMPRSGTTLIHQIAARHPQVHGAGERSDVINIAKRLGSLDDRAAAKVEAQSYLSMLHGLNSTATRIVDKMPGNASWLGLIAVLFPEARVVVCRRDARDTCLSCYFQWFSTGNTFCFDLGHCGWEHNEVQRMMDHWLSVLPIRMLEVHYEKLVADLEGESRRLIEFLGLTWDPACLEFNKAQTTVLTASVWQVRQPIYQSSVGRWRNYEKHLGPLLEVLDKGKSPQQS
jgi:tetratricopeptide (TPR) repeat protein